ncbi:MAG: pilus assembly protein PilZ [Desulfobacteraceae bacterium 4572_35.2]|nr:MAG: pilus assembly protein PilZ [Desulfobacteraceae bacterium 4572_35.2]
MTSDSQETAPPADKRQGLRCALLIKKVRLEDERRVFFGYATSISCSGLFISSINPTAIDSQFTIEISLPSPLNITFICDCETVWQRKYSPKNTSEPGMGLRFIDLDDEIKAQIDTWIHNQAEKEESKI